MKLISPEQIQTLLGIFYNTNISAKDFDAVKDFLSKLPDAPTSPKK